jgi:hypothetical protein
MSGDTYYGKTAKSRSTCNEIDYMMHMRGNDVSAATDTDATTEDMAFYMRPLHSLYQKTQRDKLMGASGG